MLECLRVPVQTSFLQREGDQTGPATAMEMLVGLVEPFTKAG